MHISTCYLQLSQELGLNGKPIGLTRFFSAGIAIEIDVRCLPLVYHLWDQCDIIPDPQLRCVEKNAPYSMFK